MLRLLVLCLLLLQLALGECPDGEICYGTEDMTSNRLAPFYNRHMECNKVPDRDEYGIKAAWFLVWAKVLKKEVQGAYNSRYTAEIICAMNSKFGSFTTILDYVTFSTTPDDCGNFQCGVNDTCIMLFQSVPASPDYMYTIADPIRADVNSNEGIAMWMALTNICPLHVIYPERIYPERADSCPNLSGDAKKFYNIPPGCFYDLSISKLRNENPLNFLYETNKKCAAIHSTDDAFQVRAAFEKSQNILYGTMKSADYISRTFQFAPECVFKHSNAHGLSNFSNTITVKSLLLKNLQSYFTNDHNFFSSSSSRS